MSQPTPQPAVPADSAASAAHDSPAAREHAVAQSARRTLLLEFLQKVKYITSLLPSRGQPDHRLPVDDKGQPLFSLSEITAANKMLSVELRHEFPLSLPRDEPRDRDEETPANVAPPDPLDGLRLLTFPEPNKPAAKTGKKPQTRKRNRA